MRFPEIIYQSQSSFQTILQAIPLKYNHLLCQVEKTSLQSLPVKGTSFSYLFAQHRWGKCLQNLLNLFWRCQSLSTSHYCKTRVHIFYLKHMCKNPQEVSSIDLTLSAKIAPSSILAKWQNVQKKKKKSLKKWVKFSNLFVSSEEKRKIATFRTVFSQSLTRRKSSGKIKIFPNYCIYRKCQHIKITKCTKKHPGSYEEDSLTQWRTEEKQKLLAPVKIWRTLKLTNPLKCWQPAHSTY